MRRLTCTVWKHEIELKVQKADCCKSRKVSRDIVEFACDSIEKSRLFVQPCTISIALYPLTMKRDIDEMNSERLKLSNRPRVDLDSWETSLLDSCQAHLSFFRSITISAVSIILLTSRVTLNRDQCTYKHMQYDSNDFRSSNWRIGKLTYQLWINFFFMLENTPSVCNFVKDVKLNCTCFFRHFLIFKGKSTSIWAIVDWKELSNFIRDETMIARNVKDEP